MVNQSHLSPFCWPLSKRLPPARGRHQRVGTLVVRKSAEHCDAPACNAAAAARKPAGESQQRANLWRQQRLAKQSNPSACCVSSCRCTQFANVLIAALRTCCVAALLLLQENISSGRAQEGLTVYHEGGQLMPPSDACLQYFCHCTHSFRRTVAAGKRMAVTAAC